MIDEYWTWKFYGYHSDELKHNSNKPVVARCDGCCQYRISTNNQYRDLCIPCAARAPESRYNKSEAGKRRLPMTDEHRQNLSKALKGKKKSPRTEEHSRKISEANKGKKRTPFTKEHRRKLSQAGIGKIISEEQRRGHSAAMRGICIEDWNGFVSDGDYCHLFDKACRERIRVKYGYRCFMCNVSQEDNGQKLCVHHVDMNKDQGCNGHEWKLVPLCRSCHSSSHGKLARSRIEYLLEFVWE